MFSGFGAGLGQWGCFKYWFVLISMLTYGVSLAQETVADSLRLLLKAPDLGFARRSQLLTDLAWEYAYENPDSVLALGRRAMAFSKQANDIHGMGVAEATLGLYYDISSQIDKAVFHYLNSYKLLKSIGHWHNAAAALNNIGIVYYHDKQFEKAKLYFTEALEIEIDQDARPRSLAESYLNLGAVYSQQGLDDSAMVYHRLAARLYLQVNDSDGFYQQMSNFASYHIDRGHADSAEYFVKRGVAYARNHQQNFALINYLLNLGEIRKIQKRYAEGQEVLLEALILSEKTGNRVMYMDALERLAEMVELKGDYKLALVYTQKHRQMRDSLQMHEAQLGLQRLEQEFQTEKKELEIEQLAKTNALNALEIEKQSTDKKYLSAILILVLGLVTIGAILMWSLRSGNRRLADKNTLIEQQVLEIQALAKESHHRIKNNLQSVISILRLQARSTQNEDTRKRLAEAQQRLQAIALMHQSLYSNDRFDQIELQSFVKQLVVNIQNSVDSGTKSILLLQDVEAVPIQTDFALPLALTLNELITNAFKYAFDENVSGEVHIKARKVEGVLMVEVHDNGKGFPEGFDLEKNANFGYRLLRTLLHKMKGEIAVENRNGAYIELKLAKF